MGGQGGLRKFPFHGLVVNHHLELCDQYVQHRIEQVSDDEVILHDLTTWRMTIKQLTEAFERGSGRRQDYGPRFVEVLAVEDDDVGTRGT